MSLVPIITNPPTIDPSGNQPVISVDSLPAPQKVTVLERVIQTTDPSTYDSSWERISSYLRPRTITDRVMIGNGSFVSTEMLRVVGDIYSTNLTVSTQLNIGDSVANITQSGTEMYLTDSTGTFSLQDLLGSSVTAQDIINWNLAFSWGDHSLEGYLTAETDPIFSASAAYGITGTNITNWNLAYTNNHTHANKTLLDSLTSTGSATAFLAGDGAYHTVPVVPGGSNTEIQFNSGGTAFGGDSRFTINTTTGLLTSYDELINHTLYIGDTNTQIYLSSGDLMFQDVNANSGSPVSLTTLFNGSTNYWTSIATGIYYGTGTNRVGINTNTPSTALEVLGTITATDFSSDYFRYKKGNWLIGTDIGESMIRNNCLAMDISDTLTPLALYDFTSKLIELEGEVYIGQPGGTSRNLTVNNNISTQYLMFGTSPVAPGHAEGMMYWNSTRHCLNIMPDISGNILQVGEELWVRVYNNTASTIVDGTPVYITSAAGDLIYIAPARANSEGTSITTLGLANSNIAAGAEGFVTILGGVHNINTSGLTEGALVYVSASVAGGLTSTRPTPPNTIACVGVCSVRDVSNGAIQVKITVQPTVERLSNVYVTGISDGQTLTWDAGNSRWKNTTIAGYTAPADNILDWDVATNCYKPYASQQAFLSFDTSSTAPALNTNLNLNGILSSKGLYTKSVTYQGATSGQINVTPALAVVGGNYIQKLQCKSGTIALTADIPTFTESLNRLAGDTFRWSELNQTFDNKTNSEDYSFNLLNAFPLSFIRDTSKINIPWSYHNLSEHIEGDKYQVISVGTGYVVIDRAIPLEVLEINDDSSKKWIIGTAESNYGFVTSIDTSSNTIYYTGGTFTTDSVLEFFCYNRNQTILNAFFNRGGWSPYDTTTTGKGCVRLYRKDINTLVGWYNTGTPYDKIGVVESTDYFATRTYGNYMQSGVDNGTNDLTMFMSGQQIQMFNTCDLGNGLHAGIMIARVDVGGVTTPRMYSMVWDNDMVIKYNSYPTYMEYYPTVTIEGYAGVLRSPMLFMMNGKLKIVFIHQRGTISSYGDNWKIYIGDYELETCTYKNLELIGSSTTSVDAVDDSTINYIAGEIDSVIPITYRNKVYIAIGGTAYGTVAFDTLISGNRYFGFLYNEGGRWIYDENGPTILTPKGETIFGVAVGDNTHFGGGAFFIDETTNKLYANLLINLGNVYYENILSEFDLNRTGNTASIPQDNILDWDGYKYLPYTSQQMSISFDTSTTDPILLTRLNLNAKLYVSELNITGKLTVGGIIDTTGLQLDHVAANPGDAMTLWANSGDSDALYYGATKISGGDYTFSNGLTEISRSVKLGGILIEDTTISVDNNDYTLIQERFIDGGSFTNTGGYSTGTVIVNEIYKTSAGKYIAVGLFTHYNEVSYRGAIRFTSSKSLDNSYNIGTGFDADNYTELLKGYYVNGVVEDTSGNLYYTGLFTSFNGTNVNRICKTNANGTLDTTFAANVMSAISRKGFDNQTNNITIQSDDKIIVTGTFVYFNGANTYNRIIRLNSDGTVDTEFTSAGFNGTTIGSLVDGSNKIVVWGYFSNYGIYGRERIARLNTDGSLDTGFTSPVFNINENVYNVALQSSGKLICVGTFTEVGGNSYGRIVRLNTNGTVDTGFNSGGAGANGTINHVLVLSDDSIIITGAFTTYNGTPVGRIAKLTTSGTLDTSFNSGGAGLDDTGFHTLDDGDNKIVVTGSFTTYNGLTANKIVILTTSGVNTNLPNIYQRFNENGTTFGTIDNGSYSVFEPDGTLKMVGDATVYDDLQFQLSSGKTGISNVPTWETFTANTSAYAFAVNDYIDLGGGEPQHGWKEGTVADFHLHIATKAANTSGSNRYVKFQIPVAYADINGTYTETTLTGEYTIPNGTAALTHFLLDMGDLTLTGYHIGMQIKPRIRRIAATGGTEYSGSIFVIQCGAHLLNDTIGSRTEITK